MVVYHLHQTPIWFQTMQMERKNCDWKIPFGAALSISRKIGKDREYIAKGLELDGKPRQMWMERNRPVETSQPVKEDNLFKHTGFAGNFPIGSTKNMCSIYFLSGITGIFMSMVNNPYIVFYFTRMLFENNIIWEDGKDIFDTRRCT